MLELKPKPITSAPRVQRDAASAQPRRLQLALALLLVALVAVIVRDRQFWFGSDESALDSNTPAPEITHPVAKAPIAHAMKPKSAAAAKKHVAAATRNSTEAASDSSAVTATRTVLPPLDVEVVAGDSHRTLHPGSNATNVEITKPGSSASAAPFAPASSAAEREPISAGAGSHEANYPLLAQHMNVEGSVVLQALISTDGVIENLHVLSGPAILATAAQQAVREWKFKPVLEHGQAVETKAMITVRFAIKVADGSSKDEIATSMPLRYSYNSDGAAR
ncbi:MAG TPA: energy transducer TonB [Terriglobales bacterium]|nr:energy transducer TonB [Terriglobales bacterium]